MAQIARSLLLALLVALYAQDGRVSNVDWRRPGGAPPAAFDVVAAPGGFALVEKSGGRPVEAAFLARDRSDGAVFRLGDPRRDLQSPPIDLAKVVDGFAKLDLRRASKASVRATIDGTTVAFELSRKGRELVLEEPATGDRFGFR